MPERQVKKFVYLEVEKKEHLEFVLIPRIPVLRYHGIDPENLSGAWIDCYYPTGKRKGSLFEYRYQHTRGAV